MRIGIGQTDSTDAGCGFWDYFFGTCPALTTPPTPAPAEADSTPQQVLTQSCEQAGGSAEDCAAANPVSDVTTGFSNTFMLLAVLGIGAFILFAAVKK